VANGVVYIGSYDHNVYALSASTGTPLWHYATGNEVFSSPAVADDVVYVGSTDQNLYAVNARTGALLWTYNTDGWVQSSPAVANGMVYLGTSYGTVYSFGLPAGESEEDAASKRPDLKMLRPDIILKAFRSVVTPSGAEP
jgi:outer membrane protein assembly factor BamB